MLMKLYDSYSHSDEDSMAYVYLFHVRPYHLENSKLQS